MEANMSESQAQEMINDQIAKLCLVEELIEKENISPNEVVHICIALLAASCTNQEQVDYVIGEFKNIITVIGFNSPSLN